MGPRQGKVGTNRQMRNERPVIVLVFAILNIVFGGLGIICSFCSGTSVGLAAGMMSAAGSTVPITPIPSSVLTIFDRRICNRLYPLCHLDRLRHWPARNESVGQKIICRRKCTWYCLRP